MHASARGMLVPRPRRLGRRCAARGERLRARRARARRARGGARCSRRPRLRKLLDSDELAESRSMCQHVCQRVGLGAPPCRTLDILALRFGLVASLCACAAADPPNPTCAGARPPARGLVVVSFQQPEPPVRHCTTSLPARALEAARPRVAQCSRCTSLQCAARSQLAAARVAKPIRWRSRIAPPRRGSQSYTTHWKRSGFS